MTPEQLKSAAQVMLDAAKSGAIVEYALRDSYTPGWKSTNNPIWDWQMFDYRIAAPKHTTLDDLPPVCWVRKFGQRAAHLVRSVDDSDEAVLFWSDWYHISDIRGTHEYSADRKTWTPFS